jgi:hypothetical protein
MAFTIGEMSDVKAKKFLIAYADDVKRTELAEFIQMKYKDSIIVQARDGREASTKISNALGIYIKRRSRHRARYDKRW